MIETENSKNLMINLKFKNNGQYQENISHKKFYKNLNRPHHRLHDIHNKHSSHHSNHYHWISIHNALKTLVMFIVLCSLLDLCKGDVEPKPHYDDLTTSISKLDHAGAAHNINMNSINNGQGHDGGGSGGHNDGVPFSNESTKSSSTIADLGFIHAFIASISVILVSELGDKTFFIAAIMAMRYPRLTVFIGAISALALMTILSAVFGMAATIIPRVYTYYISTALFAIFGLKMLKEGYYMSPTNAQEVSEEVQSDLRKHEDKLKEVSATLVQDPESGVIRSAAYLASRIFMQAFTMTFLAEWGDRSQLTTIILSAREDVYGVIVGGVLGHSMCTGLAVIGGRMIAQKISVRTVTLVGGVVFLLFAISALFFNPNEEQP